MIRLSFLGFLLYVSGNIFSQRDSYASLELLGSGGIASLNYERDLLTKGPLDLQFRGGFSFLPIDNNNGTTLIFPAMIHAVFGQKTSRADLGFGMASSITTRAAYWFRFPLSLGYRIEPPSKNFYLRFSYTPLISLIFDRQWEHWGGLSVGFKLSNRNAK
jgi:hypothetical protein